MLKRTLPMVFACLLVCHEGFAVSFTATCPPPPAAWPSSPPSFVTTNSAINANFSGIYTPGGQLPSVKPPSTWPKVSVGWNPSNALLVSCWIPSSAGGSGYQYGDYTDTFTQCTVGGQSVSTRQGLWTICTTSSGNSCTIKCS